MKKLNKGQLCISIFLLLISEFSSVAANDEKIQLGRLLFIDKNLSLNRSQACATCHNPAAGFVDDRGNGVGSAASLGDDGQSLGDRTAPSAAYAAFSPKFHFNAKSKKYIGGQFWDGRATDLQAQAGGPPLNPAEMGLPDVEAVRNRLEENDYYVIAFREIYGQDIFNNSDEIYQAMTDSIAAFERSDYFSPFDSKYDRYLQGEYEMTAQEELGMSLFFSNNNTNCVSCHILKGEDKPEETFSNYEFHNIGTPVNNALRVKNGVDVEHIDHGLLDNPAVKDVEQDGKYKVPTLRNISVTAPYMHNGIFSELKTVIEFYDKYNNPKRKNNPETGKPWQQPEVSKTVNKEELKAKRLTNSKIDALIAFLGILTDKRYEHMLR